MRKLFLASVLFISLISCKKEAESVVQKTSTTEDSIVQQKDSANVIMGDKSNPFQLDVLADQPDLGKTIFSADGKTIISFDTEANIGKLKIDGTEYALNHLVFSENEFEISGKGISIKAENGAFSDTNSDCAYGVFPYITVIVNGSKSTFRNIKVQDCPNYN